MTKAPKRWVRVKALPPEQKSTLDAACESFIATGLTPRFLTNVDRGSVFYPADISGRWRGHRYSFIKHHRASDPSAEVVGFDQPYALPTSSPIAGWGFAKSSRCR